MSGEGGAEAGSNRTERSAADKAAPLGIATVRAGLRAAAALGHLDEAPVLFEPAGNVCQAGVLLLLPALLSQGLLKQGTEAYGALRKGYYGLRHVLLTLAFMALCRIKSPEQLKNCRPGELGRVMGLDRVPEAKCLRMKIGEITGLGRARQYGLGLAREWMSQEGCLYFYVDGHVKVYHGHKALLPKKYIARQKLCMAGTTEYWVNNGQGLPYFMVAGTLNEKLKDALLNHIVPALVNEAHHLPSAADLAADPGLPLLTLVFDREAYEPSLFKTLWDTHRIAVITYRKNIRDNWPEKDFEPIEIEVIGRKTTINVCERKTHLAGMDMREVRKLSESGHQTAIVTTDRTIGTAEVAGKMFSRWSQENFFKYALADFDLDRMAQYGVQEADPESRVVNPAHRRASYQIKKAKEKIARLKARQMAIVEKNLEQDIDTIKDALLKQARLHDEIEDWQQKLEQLKEERSHLDSHITVGQMAEGEKYQSLKTESKLFMNTIKMVAYRAESAVANILAPHYRKAENEIRMLVKEIIQSDADLIPDYEKKTLTVRLHSLSTPRANRAVQELCILLNETETVFPGSELLMVFETL